MGGDYFALCLALEELARVDSSVAITLEAGVSLGAMPIYRFGTEEQKREWLPELRGGHEAGRVRPHRARRRLRRGRHPHHRQARRRRVGDQRLEGVHHQLRHRHHRRSSRSPRSPATAAPTATGRSPRSWCPRARPGFTVSQKYSKVGWNASDTRELFFDDVRVPAANLRRRARPRLRPVPLDPRRGPGRDRGAGRRARAGLRRRVGALRPRPAGVRPLHRLATRPSSS